MQGETKALQEIPVEGSGFVGCICSRWWLSMMRRKLTVSGPEGPASTKDCVFPGTPEICVGAVRGIIGSSSSQGRGPLIPHRDACSIGGTEERSCEVQKQWQPRVMCDEDDDDGSLDETAEHCACRKDGKDCDALRVLERRLQKMHTAIPSHGETVSDRGPKFLPPSCWSSHHSPPQCKTPKIGNKSWQ